MLFVENFTQRDLNHLLNYPQTTESTSFPIETSDKMQCVNCSSSDIFHKRNLLSISIVILTSIYEILLMNSKRNVSLLLEVNIKILEFLTIISLYIQLPQSEFLV